MRRQRRRRSVLAASRSGAEAYRQRSVRLPFLAPLAPRQGGYDGVNSSTPLDARRALRRRASAPLLTSFGTNAGSSGPNNVRGDSARRRRELAMPSYPSGTVIFLFTDIEGSTARWERNAAAMLVAVQRHFALLDA